jgi:deoxyribonuclease V
MRPARPDLAPDPALDREEMEALQRRVAELARFEDDLSFDPTVVSLASADRTLDNWNAAGSSATVEATGTDAHAADDAGERQLVAGVDQAFLDDDRAVSAVVVFCGDSVVERAHAVTDLSVPYVPGLLSFREGGPILAAFERLDSRPDLALFDGSGRIHYRQAGLATHMGVVLDLPSVGVAKSLLCGRPRASVDGRPAGWRTPIEADASVDAPAGTVLGYAYQSRQYETDPVVNPLYVSPGHRVSAVTAVDLVSRLCGQYKLPEPVRAADAYADDVKRDVG